jgi:hypothetical protein
LNGRAAKGKVGPIIIKMSTYLTVDSLRNLYSHIEVDHAGLVLKFSLLRPMVTNESLRNRYLEGPRGPGFRAVVEALCNDCVLTIRRLFNDAKDDTPSLGTIFHPFLPANRSKFEAVLSQLRTDREKMKTRRNREPDFDHLVEAISDAWPKLSREAEQFGHVNNLWITRYRVEEIETDYYRNAAAGSFIDLFNRLEQMIPGISHLLINLGNALSALDSDTSVPGLRSARNAHAFWGIND